MTRALVSALDVTAHRDAFDLDLRPAQERRTDRGSRRLVRAEPLRIDLVHRLEVREVREEHRGLRHAVERRIGRDKDCGEVVQDAPGLDAYVVAADELTALGVEGELPGAEHQVTRD